jgi:glutathione-independent formaldehyde dehydrogenase
MRAVIFEGPGTIDVRDVPDAEIRETSDVLLRITSTAIWGTDLHFYEGRIRGIEGAIIPTSPNSSP